MTCVRFNPAKDSEVLTVGRDNVARLIDSRKTSEEIQSFHHTDFRIDSNYALCAISPDGRFDLLPITSILNMSNHADN